MDNPRTALMTAIFSAATPDELMLNPAASRSEFLHAFVLIDGGRIVSPTLFERAGNKLVGIELAKYVEENGAREVRKHKRATVMSVVRETSFKAHLWTGKPTKGGPFVGRLLSRLNVPFSATPEGGLLPG